MKKHILKIIILMYCITSPFCYSQGHESQQENDSVFAYQQRFEDYLTAYKEMYKFNIDDENREPQILETENELTAFIEFIFRSKYPKAVFNKVNISEDRTGKIWFAYTKVMNSLMKNSMMIIVCKGTCKVLLFEMDR